MGSRAQRLLLPLVYLGFVSLGLPDGTLGVAWPQLHAGLALPIGMAGALALVSTLLSAGTSFHSGAIVARFGTGPIVLGSCALTAMAMLVMAGAQGPAALFLASAMLGSGGGAVDAGLNGYVARHYSGRHMNWLHACWGIGATCGPLAMSAAVAREAGWRTGYRSLALVQAALALVFLFTLRLWHQAPARPPRAPGASGAAPSTPARSAAGWLSATVFALYAATETTVGLWAGSILVARGLLPEAAGLCTAAYYGAITTGRIAVGFVAERLGNRRIVRLGLASALAGALLFSMATSAAFAAACLVLVGAGFAPVYPCLMHEVPQRFAPAAVPFVIGRQSSAAYAGSACLPALAGVLAESSLEGVACMVVFGIVVMLGVTARLDRIT